MKPLNEITPKLTELRLGSTGYRTYREARAIAATPDPLIRFLFVAVSFLLRNLWLVVRWAVVARGRAGATSRPSSRSNWSVAGSETI